jgi:hypothetical protein
MKIRIKRKVLGCCCAISMVVMALNTGKSQNINDKDKLNDNPGIEFVLNRQMASKFAGLALKCLQKEYPNKPEHVLNDGSELKKT